MAKKPFTMKLMGKRWKLVYVPTLGKRPDGKPWSGKCDPDDHPGKRVLISKEAVNGRPLEELDTLLHELLHACCFKPLSEEWVFDAATDIAKVLWDLGYRKVAPEDAA